MKKLWIVCAVVVLFGVVTADRPPGRAGGAVCGACTAAMAILGQQVEYHNGTIDKVLRTLCKYFDNPIIRGSCDEVIIYFYDTLAELFHRKFTPDVICHSLNVCKDKATGPQCHLFPTPPGRDVQIRLGKMIVEKHVGKNHIFSKPDFCNAGGDLGAMCDFVEKSFTTIRPGLDLDKDGFSTIEAFHGSLWRGRDCNDVDKDIHPGSKSHNGDENKDYNCNGIYGVDAKTQESYEDKFCDNSGQMGTIILGDSAGANFRIPEQWLTPQGINKGTLSHIPYAVSNQLDWPMMSAVTGFKNITWPIMDDTVYSLYQRMRERNLCNHRDYVNLCHNGANVQELYETLWNSKATGFSRDPQSDQPAFITIALVGNDVCNGFENTLDKMTTPDEMFSYMLETIVHLNSTVPKGSKVLLVGLADGRYLYERLADRYHPIGQLNQNVKYSDFYTYLSCIDNSPCNGWMTTNATLRDLTSKRAEQLSKTLAHLAHKYKDFFSNIEVNYIDCPFTAAMAQDFGGALTSVAIEEQKTFQGQPFPLVLSPSEQTKSRDIDSWLQWIEDNKAAIKDELLKYSTILFRDFPISSAEDFDKFVKQFGYKSFPYVGGAAPRTVVTGNVFTANEAPPSEKIPYHHEMAQVPNFPKVLFFNCEVAPPTGGQTTLVPSNVIYQEMLKRRPEFVNRLETEGVRYIRVMPENDDPKSPIGRGWKSTYLTDNKEEVVRKAGEQGTELQWLDDGNLKTTTKILPGVKVDPRTGKKTWFNSIIAAYLGWQDSRNDCRKAVVFANGDCMQEDDMKTLEEVFEENAVDFVWKKGDIVMVDNRQALHARRPFTPPRRVLACLCDDEE